MTTRPVCVNGYSYIWTHSAEATVRHLASLGYSLSELMVSEPHLWPTDLGAAERRSMARLLANEGAEILSLNPPSLDLNLVSPSREVRDFTLCHYRDVINLAGDWGVRFIVVVPGKTHSLLPMPRERCEGWLLTALASLSDIAETRGVELLVENVPSGFLPTAADLLAMLRKLRDPRIGAVYDVANAVFAADDPIAGLDTLREHLRLVHLSDTGLDRWRHDRIGSGVVPFMPIASALDSIGFSGPVVLEIISDDPDRDIAAGHEAVAALGLAAPRTKPLGAARSTVQAAKNARADRRANS